MEPKQPNQKDITEAMRLAMSPAGKQLMNLLQQSNAQGLQTALESASAGNFEQAKNAINAFLSTPEARELLEKLRDTP